MKATTTWKAGVTATLIGGLAFLMMTPPANAEQNAPQTATAQPPAAASQPSTATGQPAVQTPLTAGSLPTVSQTISLNDAVNLALQNNPRPVMQAAEANAALARIGMARAMTKPQVSTTTFGTIGNMENIVPGSPNVQPQAFLLVPDKGQLDQNLTAMFPLYTGGRLKGQVRSAQAQYSAATQTTRGTQLDVALEAKTAYRRVQLNQQFVDVYRRRVDEARERVRIAEASYAEGRIAKYDLLRNQTDLAEAEQELNNALRDVDTAMVDLKSVLGISLGSQLTVAEVLTCVPLTQTLENVQSQALRQRPEIAAAKARIQSAEANVGVVKSAYKPQIYATGMYDFALANEMGFGQGGTVGITASLPILDGGQRKSAVNESLAMLESARAGEREAVLMVNRDIGTVWAEQAAASKNVTLAQAAVTAAEEDYRVIRLRYEAGKATNVEVLDALAALTRARTNYAQAQFEFNTAQDRLNRAMGNT